MRFFNMNIKYMAHNAALFMASALLVACASQQAVPQKTDNQVIDDQASSDKSVELMATEQYLPVQTYDAQNQLIPYQPKDNPYLAKKAQVDKGSVLLFIEAKEALRKDDVETAKQKLNVIIRNDKKLSGPWMILGDIAVGEKKYDQAQEHYQQGLLINPSNVNGYTALATVQRLKGEYRKSQNTLAKALALWPDFPEAHYNLSILFDIYLNQTDKAKQHLNAFILLEGSDEESQQWLQQLSERMIAEEG